MPRLTKSYRLLRFLNSQPNGLLRGSMGVLAAVYTLFVTGDRRLARMIWHGIWVNRNLKTAFRQVAWLSARSRRGFVALDDPLFDPAQSVPRQDIAAMEEFLSRHGCGTLQSALDQLTLLAHRPEYPMPAEEWSGFAAEFAALANNALSLATNVAPSVATSNKHLRGGDFEVDAAGRALADFSDCLDQDALPWFVISGTFLGLYREGGFLAHDYDIDLGMMAKPDQVARLAGLLKNNPHFRLSDQMAQQQVYKEADGTVDATMIPVLMKLVHDTGVHIDVFLHYSDSDGLWHGSNVHRWYNSHFSLAPYTLDGTDVLGPANAETYLSENYGDWRTPRLDFNASTGTPNLSMAPNVPSVALMLKRLALALAEGDTMAAQLKESLIESGLLRQDVDQPTIDIRGLDSVILAHSPEDRRSEERARAE